MKHTRKHRNVSAQTDYLSDLSYRKDVNKQKASAEFRHARIKTDAELTSWVTQATILKIPFFDNWRDFKLYCVSDKKKKADLLDKEALGELNEDHYFKSASCTDDTISISIEHSETYVCVCVFRSVLFLLLFRTYWKLAFKWPGRYMWIQTSSGTCKTFHFFRFPIGNNEQRQCTRKSFIWFMQSSQAVKTFLECPALLPIRILKKFLNIKHASDVEVRVQVPCYLNWKCLFWLGFWQKTTAR